MVFTIPDKGEGFHSNQSVLMQTDIGALVAGIQRNGVLSGCAVTASTPEAMTVDIASGEILFGGSQITVSAAPDTAISAADSNNPRIDLVSVNNAGAVVIVAGTAALKPKAPDLGANRVLLGMVYVPANDTAISQAQIIDKRLLLGESPFQIPERQGGDATNWNTAGTTDFAVPASKAYVGTVTLSFSSESSKSIVINFPASFGGFPIVITNASDRAGLRSFTSARVNSALDSVQVFVHTNDGASFSGTVYLEWIAIGSR